MRPSGSKLSDGTSIIPLPGHILSDSTFAGIKNLAKAIFVSPSLFYASDVVFAERIISNNQTWAVLIEGRLKPNTFTKYKSTVLDYNNIPGEPAQVEYIVEQNKEKNIIITS